MVKRKQRKKERKKAGLLAHDDDNNNNNKINKTKTKTKTKHQQTQQKPLLHPKHPPRRRHPKHLNHIPLRKPTTLQTPLIIWWFLAGDGREHALFVDGDVVFFEDEVFEEGDGVGGKDGNFEGGVLVAGVDWRVGS